MKSFAAKSNASLIQQAPAVQSSYATQRLKTATTIVQRNQLKQLPFQTQFPLQRKSSSIQLSGEPTSIKSQSIHQVAATGVQGTGSKLPHFDKIQQSFGRFDVSNVQAYSGASAAAANKAMGAEAYATGNKIAFSKSSPSLHTAAHEAAHIVQQRAGIHLKGGVGETGDRYEQHADAVANRVVQGKTAEDLLSQVNNASIEYQPGKKVQGLTSKIVSSGFTPLVQMAKGTARQLDPDQYPVKPQPTWYPTKSGPYTVPYWMDSWLVPGQLNGGGDPVYTKFYLDVSARNKQYEDAGTYEYGYYHRGHVLAKSLGGPATRENMVPLTETANYAMRDGPEVAARNYLRRGKASSPGIVHYKVDIEYGGHDVRNIMEAEKYLPTKITAKAEVHQGPANVADLKNLSKWRETEPTETLYNDSIEMKLRNDFNEIKPGIPAIGATQLADKNLGEFFTAYPGTDTVFDNFTKIRDSLTDDYEVVINGDYKKDITNLNEDTRDKFTTLDGNLTNYTNKLRPIKQALLGLNEAAFDKLGGVVGSKANDVLLTNEILSQYGSAWKHYKKATNNQTLTESFLLWFHKEAVRGTGDYWPVDNAYDFLVDEIKKL